MPKSIKNLFLQGGGWATNNITMLSLFPLGLKGSYWVLWIDSKPAACKCPLCPPATSLTNFFIFFFKGAKGWPMHRAYSPGIKPRLASCKASILPTVLSSQASPPKTTF